MDNKCNDDNLFVKPIELCSLNALNILSSNQPSNEIYRTNNDYIFQTSLISLNSDLNKDFRDSTNNNNYKFKYEGIGERNKNLCGQTNKIEEYYLNCVLQNNNPLFTYKDGYCLVSPEINLPSEFKKIEDKKEIIIKLDRYNLEDEEGNFKYQQIQNNKYCEDRWYDWIVIPNYHLGNRIFKDSGAYSKEDVKICYNNCKEGELPYINSKGSNLCIPKEIAYDGIYENKLDYSPLALINLIGNNKKNLNLLYKNLFYYEIIKKIIKYSINTDVNLSENLSSNDNYIVNEVFDKIKKILNKFVNDDNLNIPDFSLEYKHLTYKHPYFKENDLISILGMDKNEILSNDIILIHTAYLAYYYYDFIKNIKNNPTYFDTNNIVDINKHDNHDFNITKVLTDYNNSFDLKSKRQRLANILYKAINICYNKKTDFSKNLIKRTLDALKKYDNVSINNLSLLKPNQIEFNSNDINIYRDFKNNETIKEYITNGFEIDYYKYNSLKDFYEKIQKKEIITNISSGDETNFRNLFQNKFLFYTEEDSEIIYGNKCKVGMLLNSSNICVSCNDECGSLDQCSSNINCKTFCETKCINIINKNENTKCGGTTIEDDIPIKNKQQEIKTPIEEETNIPDLTCMFKSAIKIFFILIVLYIAYMFYKIFNESILTFGNLLYGFFDSLYYNIIVRDKIKIAEHYEKIIQDKYNTIIMKTMT